MRTYLTSRHNANIRRWRQLQTAKGRARQQACLVEGVQAVIELLQDVEPVQLLVGDHYRGPWPLPVRSTPPVYHLTKALFNYLSTTQNSQGLLAVMPIPRWSVSPQAPARSSPAIYLLLDSIRDPGNLGSLLRTAWSLGGTAVFLSEESADPWQPKVVRTARRAAWQLPIFSLQRQLACQWFAEQAIPLWGAVAAGATLLPNLRWPARVALALGNETAGLSQLVLAQLQQTVAIPMVPTADSLNVAIAGALCLATYAWQHIPLLPGSRS